MLDAQIVGYVTDDETYTIVPQVFGYGKQHSFLVTLHKEPPDEWGPLIGDAVHNLRCALDHIMWELADPALRGRHTMFPIYTDADDFKFGLKDKRGKRNYSSSGLRRLAGVPPLAIAVIEAAQPYQPAGGKPFHPNIGLNILNQLDNWDKHRALHTVASVFRRIEARDFPNLASGESIEVDTRMGPLVAGEQTEVFKLKFPRVQAAVGMKVDLPLEILFVEPQVVEGLAVSETMSYCVKAVETVIDDLHPHVPV